VPADPGAVRGAGTDGRLWVAEASRAPLPPGPYDTTEREERIAVRDGTGLAAVIIEPVLPAGSPPQPCVVVTNGYSGLDYSLRPDLRLLAAYGYPVVLARLRGVPPSEGRAGLYERYGQDGHDVVEWAAGQSFCDGRVGMVGASLLAISQWLAARERPPHLVVVVPDDSPNDTYRYLWYLGGMEPGPGRRHRAEVPGVESEYGTAVSHPWFDDFWRQRAMLREDFEALARAGLPALTSSGWDSYMIEAASRPFTWMRDAGAGRRARLVIGPWRHAGMFHASDNLTYDVPPGSIIRPHTGFELQKLWLDRWLRGELNGIDAEPPVQIFVQGPDQWRYEHDWPLPDEHRIRLYLAGGPSQTVISRNDGMLATELPAVDGEAGYTFDPASSRSPVAVSMPSIVMVADAEPTIKETILPAGARREHGRLIMDKSGYEAQAVTWTSPELPQPTEITGYPRLVLWASVSRPDADFIAELTDVAPRGDGTWSSTQITRGYLRASAQFSTAGPTELDPGDVCRYELELQPTSYVVPAGHRIRFAVQGAAIDPDIDVSWHGPGLGEHPFTVRIRTGPEYASYAEVPVIGSVPDLG
jgi:putative CocE/NonD family hydrolase